MVVTIGIQNLAREVRVETDAPEEVLVASISKAIEDGSPLILTSTKGHTTFIPSATIAYVELGPNEKRAVGFAQL